MTPAGWYAKNTVSRTVLPIACKKREAVSYLFYETASDQFDSFFRSVYLTSLWNRCRNRRSKSSLSGGV